VVRKEMNDIVRTEVDEQIDEYIVEMQKLLIWSNNTYKQMKKPEWEEEGRSME
jgi:hypothetical protein